MDYLQTTGDRLHDLELDRILGRLRTLEAATSAASTKTPAVTSAVVSSTVAGVRSITPGSGTQMSSDIVLAVSGPLTIAQATNTITMTANTLAAGSNITLTTVGTTTTIAANGGSANPTDALIISPLSWVVPAALTEFDGSKAYRSQHDLTNATQARLCILLPSVSLLLSPPTLAAQYSTNGGTIWSYLDGSAGPSATYGSSTTLLSSWVTLAAGAKADVLLRVVASGGDGTTSVTLGTIYLQVK